MLGTFGWIAIKDFEKDKIAYVLDTNLSHSRVVSSQIKSEVNYVVEKIASLVRVYKANHASDHSEFKNAFTSETKIDSLLLFTSDNNAEKINTEFSLVKEGVTAEESEALEKSVKQFAADSAKQSDSQEDAFSIYRPFENSKWIAVVKLKTKYGQPIYAASLLNFSYFLSAFDNAQIQDTFLVNAKSEVILKPKISSFPLAQNELAEILKTSHDKLQSNEGVFEYTSNNEGYLVSTSTVSLGNLKVVSIIPKSAALEAVKLMIVKASLFLAFLIFVTVALSIISSTKLTASLKRLTNATKEIAKGNFSVILEAGSKDEVGTLSNGFNVMTAEIQRLLIETAEKARMESELKTAQLVQQTLFPKEHHKEHGLEILGHYQPASECSGDWWYYKKINNKTMFCIGDATGHGVPAALLTAAARSAASAIEKFPTLSLSNMMDIFNTSIYNTAKGQVMMTMFLGLYDHDTGTVEYCNASHEPPFLLPNVANLTKNDFQLLHAANGPRLGESSDASYQSAEIKLSPGEKIVLYTDGVTEIRNQTGDMWGERALIRCLISCHNDKKNLAGIMVEIDNQLNTFRSTHPLEDDVTYFMLERAS